MVEVKMVYTASDDALTDDDGQLIDQLDRAARVFPEALVLGVVFALYQPETGEDLSPAEGAADRMLAAVRSFRTKAKQVGSRATANTTAWRAQALLTLIKGETDRAMKEIEADFRTLGLTQ